MDKTETKINLYVEKLFKFNERLTMLKICNGTQYNNTLFPHKENL